MRVSDVSLARRELEAKGVQFIAETWDSGVCHFAAFRDLTAIRSSCIAGTRRGFRAIRGENGLRHVCGGVTVSIPRKRH